jgi:hypothetical protein
MLKGDILFSCVADLSHARGEWFAKYHVRVVKL